MLILYQLSYIGLCHVVASLYRSDNASDYNLHNKYSDYEASDITPMIKTGVDWRSLTTPALLPISTDFYPDEQKFQNYYNDQVYTLDPLFDS